MQVDKALGTVAGVKLIKNHLNSRICPGIRHQASNDNQIGYLKEVEYFFPLFPSGLSMTRICISGVGMMA